MMRNYLLEAMEERQVLMFYGDGHRTPGIPFALGEDWVVFARFSDGYRYIGIEAIRTDLITRLVVGGTEHTMATQRFIPKGLMDELPSVDASSTTALLQGLNDWAGYVCVHPAHADTCFIGPVVEVDGEALCLENYPSGALSDPDPERVLLSLEDINRIEVGGDYEEWLKAVHTPPK